MNEDSNPQTEAPEFSPEERALFPVSETDPINEPTPLAKSFLAEIAKYYDGPVGEDYQEDKFYKFEGLWQRFIDDYLTHDFSRVDDSLAHLGFIDFYFNDGSSVEVDINKKRAFFLT